MHLLETQALMTGSIIDKPYIFEQYFPLPVEKYITFQAQTKFEAKDYDLFQDVINLIYPTLEKLGIKIVQVGGPNELSYQRVIDLRGKTEIPQLAYIIKNSILHFGPDSFGVHLAAGYNIPLIGLYSVSQSGVCGPAFGDKEKQICFDAYLRTGNKKPSYQDKEPQKCVNLIKPEEIANAIFKLLNIKENINFETIYTGQRYNSRVIREIVPVVASQIQSPEIPLIIRMDVHFNEQELAKQLSVSKGVIMTNKPIRKELLVQFKMNIVEIIYVIEEKDEPEFVNQVRNMGLKISLISALPKDKIKEKKLNYYEFGNIDEFFSETPEMIEMIKSQLDKIYFKSNRIVLENGKIYMGNTARVNKEEYSSEFKYFKAVDCPEFWNELQFMTLVKTL